jgi:hypothetical protein
MADSNGSVFHCFFATARVTPLSSSLEPQAEEFIAVVLRVTGDPSVDLELALAQWLSCSNGPSSIQKDC